MQQIPNRTPNGRRSVLHIDSIFRLFEPQPFEFEIRQVPDTFGSVRILFEICYLMFGNSFYAYICCDTTPFHLLQISGIFCEFPIRG